jgi:hypothetical protein
MLNPSDAATFTAQDRSTEEVARTAAAVATVPVQLTHHVDRRLRRCLIKPLYGFRPSPNREEILGGRHIFEGREVLSSQAESRYVALSCNTKEDMVSTNKIARRHQIPVNEA